MSGWIEHDGKGVPADAKPGVTAARIESCNCARCRSQVVEYIWTGMAGQERFWDWTFYGAGIYSLSTLQFWHCPRVIAYRNPSTTAAVEALKAMARNPDRVREAT